MNTGVRSKTEPAFCSKSSKRCSTRSIRECYQTRSIRECYQMVVVGQNVLTGLPFRARAGSISKTAARERLSDRSFACGHSMDTKRGAKPRTFYSAAKYRGHDDFVTDGRRQRRQTGSIDK